MVFVPRHGGGMEIYMLFNKKGFNDEKNKVKTRKKGSLNTVDIIMIAISLILGVALWLYVYSTTNTTDEKTFNLVSIEKKNTASLFENHNLVVQSMNIDTVNVTVMGSKNVINGVTGADISAYINLIDISEAGEYRLEVLIDVPEGVTCVGQTVSYVEVTVDSSTEKTVEVTGDNVILSGWNLEAGYSFGDITTNLTSVKLEGAQNDINKISSIGLVTGSLGNVRNSMTAFCELVLLDAAGNELDLPGVYVTPSVNLNSIEAHITVFKEKTVPLELLFSYGYIEESCINITPSEVVIKGEASFVDEVESIVLGRIDEKSIAYPVYETRFDVKYDGLEILDGSGKAVNSATVKIDRSAVKSRTITGVALYTDGLINEEYEAEVTILARRGDDISLSFLNSIGEQNIRVYSQDNAEVYAVVFSDNYYEYVYECVVNIVAKANISDE